MSQQAMVELAGRIESFFDDNFIITLQELRDPKSTTVFKFLGRVLYEFNIDIESLKMTQMCQSELSSYPESYSDVIPYINVYQLYKQIFDDAEVLNDFSLKDILQPRPQKNVRIMNTVMDFLEYADAKMNDLGCLRDSKKERKAKYMELEQKKQMFRSKITEIITKQDSYEAKMNEMKAEKEMLLSKLKDRATKINSVLETKEKLTSMLTQKENKMADLLKTYKELSKERENISAKLVASPQNIISELEKQRCQRTNMKEALDQLSTKIEEIKKQNCALNKSIEDLTMKRDKLRTYKGLWKSFTDLQIKHKRETENLSKITAAFTEMEKKLAAIQQEHVSNLEKEQKELETHKDKTLAAQHKLDSKKSNIGAETNKNLEDLSKVKAVEAEIEDIDKNINKMIEHYNTIMKQLIQKYEHIKTIINLTIERTIEIVDPKNLPKY